MFRRIVVGDLERVVLVCNGQFHRILGPGTYWMCTLLDRIHAERHTVQVPEFESEWSSYLLAERPDVLKEWFTLVMTTDEQVATVYLNGKLHRVLGPGRRILLWRGPFSYRVELFDACRNPEVPARLVPALAAHGGETCAMFTVVEEGKRGLLFVDGQLRRELKPGTYAFWKTARPVRRETVTAGVHSSALALRRAGVIAAR